MPSTIEQTKNAILTHGGKASKHQIARELKISLDYAGLILGELKRKGEIAFSNGFYVLTSIKKEVIQDKEQKKPAIPLTAKQPARQSRKSKETKKAKKPRAKKNIRHSLGDIMGISESLALTLEEAGYNTIESLAEASISKLMAAAKLELHTAAQLINQARKMKLPAMLRVSSPPSLERNPPKPRRAGRRRIKRETT